MTCHIIDYMKTNTYQTKLNPGNVGVTFSTELTLSKMAENGHIAVSMRDSILCINIPVYKAR